MRTRPSAQSRPTYGRSTDGSRTSFQQSRPPLHPRFRLFISPDRLCRLTGRLLAFLTVSALLAGLTSGPVLAGSALQLGGGGWVAADSDLRDELGTSPAWTLAFAGRPRPDRDLWVDVEIGWIRSSGALHDSDPTFEVGDTDIDLIPVTVGVRPQLGVDSGARTRIYLGLGAIWALQRWDPPFGGTETSATFGAYGEIRPEVQLSDRVHLWVRERLQLLIDNQFQERYEINPSGATLSLGLRYDLEREDRK